MFYSMYLSSLCERRRWPEPLYEVYQSRQGYCCKVRVNNREYGTDVPYKTPALAQESAATKAFMICRNFSANDGMFPGQRPGLGMATSGMVQGLPVAIGSGRRSNRNSNSSVESQYSETSSSAGDLSPSMGYSGYEGQFDHQLYGTAVMPQMPRSYVKARADSSAYMCLCKRGPVAQYGQCMSCLTRQGWLAPGRLG